MNKKNILYHAICLAGESSSSCSRSSGPVSNGRHEARAEYHLAAEPSARDRDRRARTTRGRHCELAELPHAALHLFDPSGLCSTISKEDF